MTNQIDLNALSGEQAVAVFKNRMELIHVVSFGLSAFAWALASHDDCTPALRAMIDAFCADMNTVAAHADADLERIVRPAHPTEPSTLN